MKMVTTHDIFTRPRFRPGVSVNHSDSEISIEYRDQSCDLEVNAAKAELIDLLQSLGVGGKTIGELKEHYLNLASSIDSLVEEFDRLGLLTETKFAIEADCISGREFYHEIRAFADLCIQTKCRSALYEGLKQKTLKREVLIGYVLEYFYLVRQAPGLIAPSLTHAEPMLVQKLLQGFLASELNHDEMLAHSLEAVGIRSNTLELMQPLPATFSLCASLGVYAKQHTLTFKSLLFLFEMPSMAFNDALVEYCKSEGLPEKFWEPLLRHATINDELDHEDITLMLLKEIEAVSREDQIVTKKHVMIAVETMALQEKQIIDYYSKQDAIIPRIFA